MKIALIGYGRMGRAIARIAAERGHSIVCTIDKDNLEDIHSPEFRSAEVAIEFSTPATAAGNIIAAAREGVKVVSGTTGWRADAQRVEKEVLSAGADTALLWSSNFSIGVNIFRDINRRLAHAMAALSDYHPWMTEVHHINKLDHPSGTAITLAEDLSAECPRIKGWTEDPTLSADHLLVNHVRQSQVPGIHTIEWESPVDSITISHSARSRDGFALGAVMAAEWLSRRNGIRSIDEMMADLLA